MEDKKHAGMKAQPFGLKELINYQNNSVVSKEILKRKSGNVTVFAFDEGEGHHKRNGEDNESIVNLKRIFCKLS